MPISLNYNPKAPNEERTGFIVVSDVIWETLKP